MGERPTEKAKRKTNASGVHENQNTCIPVRLVINDPTH